MENEIGKNVSVFGNNNTTIIGNENTPITIGFTLEDNRKLLDAEELRLYGTWLEQIEQDLQRYNPKTALSHTEKIIQSLEKKESLNTQLMARLKYIRGCCKYECGIPNEWIIDFYTPMTMNLKIGITQRKPFLHEFGKLIMIKPKH